jgi:hypothetical protein
MLPRSFSKGNDIVSLLFTGGKSLFFLFPSGKKSPLGKAKGKKK